MAPKEKVTHYVARSGTLRIWVAGHRGLASISLVGRRCLIVNDSSVAVGRNQRVVVEDGDGNRVVIDGKTLTFKGNHCGSSVSVSGRTCQIGGVRFNLAQSEVLGTSVVSSDAGFVLEITMGDDSAVDMDDDDDDDGEDSAADAADTTAARDRDRRTRARSRSGRRRTSGSSGGKPRR